MMTGGLFYLFLYEFMSCLETSLSLRLREEQTMLYAAVSVVELYLSVDKIRQDERHMLSGTDGRESRCRV